MLFFVVKMVVLVNTNKILYTNVAIFNSSLIFKNLKKKYYLIFKYPYFANLSKYTILLLFFFLI